MVHKRHRIVDVGRETNACLDRLAALLEVRAGVTGRDHDSRAVQPLHGRQRSGQFWREGHESGTRRLDDVDVFRRGLGQVRAQVGASEGGVEKRPFDVRAQDPGTLRL